MPACLAALLCLVVAIHTVEAATAATSIAFLGDSITQFGAEHPTGYVRLVEAGLKANAIAVEVFPAGVSGNKSDDMRNRLEQDVLSHRPQWMTLSCGVNDVWHFDLLGKGIALPDYQANIGAILDRAAKAKVRVVIMTASMIGEDLDNGSNQRLAPYNDWLRAQAKERKLPLADVNADLRAAIAKLGTGGNHLTTDGVHMNDAGNRIMAICVLRALGLKAEQVAAAERAWGRP